MTKPVRSLVEGRSFRPSLYLRLASHDLHWHQHAEVVGGVGGADDAGAQGFGQLDVQSFGVQDVQDVGEILGIEGDFNGGVVAGAGDFDFLVGVADAAAFGGDGQLVAVFRGSQNWPSIRREMSVVLLPEASST